MLGAILLSLASLGADPPAGVVPEGLAQRAWNVTEVVLTHHVSPPTRQQMILDGFRALYRAARRPIPADLARKTSAVATVRDFQALLDEEWALRFGETHASAGNASRRAPKTFAEQAEAFQQSAAPRLTSSNREDVFTAGLLASVDGGARFIAAKDLKVEQQIAANRYVGLQIALGYNNDEKRPVIMEVFPGGPAARAGVLKDDLIEAIDGKTTEGEDLRASVDRLRGAEGTDVTLRVRGGKAAPRTYTITRGVLPRKTIEDIRCFGGASGKRLVDGTGLISYLRFKEIAGSTPRELRQLARMLEDEGAKALVLDFRGMTAARFHPAILLADDLLDGCVIGRQRMADRVETYTAEADALFRGLPLAVIIDERSSGVTTWVAAALKDNHRAVIVGPPSERSFTQRGPAFAGVESAVPTGDGGSYIEMMTGQLERADGRPIAGQSLTPNPTQLRRLGATPLASETEGGLVPDVVVAPRTAGRASNLLPFSGHFDGDAFTTAALARLRQQLGLPPDEPGRSTARRATIRDEVR